MTAKHKLNSAYIQGTLVIAAMVGILTESWLVFLLVAVVLISAGMHDGSIRK